MLLSTDYVLIDSVIILIASISCFAHKYYYKSEFVIVFIGTVRSGNTSRKKKVMLTTWHWTWFASTYSLFIDKFRVGI